MSDGNDSLTFFPVLQTVLGSGQVHPLVGGGGLDVRQSPHPEGVAQTDEAGEDRDEQGDLEGPVPGVVVDAQDLRGDSLGLLREELG